MTLKHFFFLILSFINLTTLCAQETTFSSTVVEVRTLTPISDANIEIKELGINTTSNTKGVFTINTQIKEGAYIGNIIHDSFLPKEFLIEFIDGALVNITNIQLTLTYKAGLKRKRITQKENIKKAKLRKRQLKEEKRLAKQHNKTNKDLAINDASVAENSIKIESIEDNNDYANSNTDSNKNSEVATENNEAEITETTQTAVANIEEPIIITEAQEETASTAVKAKESLFKKHKVLKDPSKVLNTIKTAVIFTALQQNYANLLGTAIENLSNVMLYNYIDQWHNKTYRYEKNKALFIQSLFENAYNLELEDSTEALYASDYTNKFKGKKYLNEGDLIFFNETGNPDLPVKQVGMYLQNDKFIHQAIDAYDTAGEKSVIISDLSDPYWSARFMTAGRRINNQ